jgi:hypothetical protein
VVDHVLLEVEDGVEQLRSSSFHGPSGGPLRTRSTVSEYECVRCSCAIARAVQLASGGRTIPGAASGRRSRTTR